MCTKFNYTILDKDENIVETGTVDFRNRMSWSGITLRNGERFILRPSYADTFNIADGTIMNFKFSLDRKALTNYWITKHTVLGSSIWRGGSPSEVSGASIGTSADETAGYTGTIMNYSSDPFIITYCEFSF